MKYVTPEYFIPIECSESFVEKLESIITAFKLVGYKVRENSCIPHLSLQKDGKENGSTYTIYEVENQARVSETWVLSIKLYLTQPMSQREKLKKQKLKLTQYQNTLSEIILEVPCERLLDGEYHYTKSFKNNDDKLFEYLKKFI